MSKTFFTSDTHYNHANIIRYSGRPQLRLGDEVTDAKGEKSWVSQSVARERVNEMDAFLIDRHNSRVTDSDDIYHNGDFCFGTAQDALNYLNRLNFYRFYFIWGNHDKAMQDVWRIKTGPVCAEQKKYADLLNRLYFIGNMKEIKVDGQAIVLNHYAQITWNKKPRGTWMLCGHSHYNLRAVRKDGVSIGKILDIGVDGNDYYPYTLEDIQRVMNTKPIIGTLAELNDHHTTTE